MAKIVWVLKELKLVKVFLKHLHIGSHGDCSTELFDGQKPCYDGQWPTIILSVV